MRALGEQRRDRRVVERRDRGPTRTGAGRRSRGRAPRGGRSPTAPAGSRGSRRSRPGRRRGRRAPRRRAAVRRRSLRTAHVASRNAISSALASFERRRATRSVVDLELALARDARARRADRGASTIPATSSGRPSERAHARHAVQQTVDRREVRGQPQRGRCEATAWSSSVEQLVARSAPRRSDGRVTIAMMPHMRHPGYRRSPPVARSTRRSAPGRTSRPAGARTIRRRSCVGDRLRRARPSWPPRPSPGPAARCRSRARRTRPSPSSDCSAAAISVGQLVGDVRMALGDPHVDEHLRVAGHHLGRRARRAGGRASRTSCASRSPASRPSPVVARSR